MQSGLTKEIEKAKDELEKTLIDTEPAGLVDEPRQDKLKIETP